MSAPASHDVPEMRTFSVVYWISWGAQTTRAVLCDLALGGRSLHTEMQRLCYHANWVLGHLRHHTARCCTDLRLPHSRSELQGSRRIHCRQFSVDGHGYVASKLRHKSNSRYALLRRIPPHHFCNVLCCKFRTDEGKQDIRRAPEEEASEA